MLKMNAEKENMSSRGREKEGGISRKREGEGGGVRGSMLTA